MSTLSRERYEALLDIIIDDEQGLGTEPDVENAKMVLKVAARRLDPAALLERIRYAGCALGLMIALPEIVGPTPNDLEPFAQLLLKNVEDWEAEFFEAFAVHYWTSRVRARIVLNDYVRAWDEIRKAFRGFDPYVPEPFEPIEEGEVEKLTAPRHCVASLITELYVAMLSKQLVGPVSSEAALFKDLVGPGPSDVYRRGRFNGRPEDHFPGEVFVHLFSAYQRPPGITTVLPEGQQAYQIALYFSDKRKQKRTRKVRRALAQR